METLVYRKRVHFYETDGMGVVHHSNHLRYFEEARLAWFNDRKLFHAKWADEGNVMLAVVDAGVQYKSPARYNDQLAVQLQVRVEGTRFHFRYAILDETTQRLIATGHTIHVPVNEEMRPVRPPQAVLELLKGEPWTEIWP